MDFQQLINNLYNKYKNIEDTGTVADYIPELGKVNPDNFAINLYTLSCNTYGAGDYKKRFSIQSISKVFALTLCINLVGKKLWTRMGVEPSGDPFNSLVQLEFEKGIPRNPFINSGALVMSDILISELPDPKKTFLDFVQKLAQNDSITYNLEVVASEKAFGYKNAAHVNLMKSYGNIKNNVEEVLDLYYHMCSVEMSSEELSKTFLVYANGGVLTYNNERILSKSRTKRINAIMQLCGLYDEAGEFSFRVGLPGKSGVGGGIVAVHPSKYAICVWSPRLNKKGNSFKAVRVLEEFTTETELSIF